MENNKLTELQLELSIKCNSNCVMCPRDKLTRSGKPGFMSFKIAKRIIDESYSMGARLLKPQWFGEPLLSPDFDKIVKYAKDKGMNILLVTNGSLLDEKKRKFILDNCDKVWFSIDSPDKEEYEKIRRGLSFDKVIENLHNLKLDRDKAEIKMDIWVTGVNVNGSADKLEEFFKDKCDRVLVNKMIDYSKEVNTADFRKVKCKHNVGSRLVVGWEGTPYLCCHDWLGEYPLPNLQARRIRDIWYCCKRKQHLRNLDVLQICQKCMLSSEQWTKKLCLIVLRQLRREVLNII